jgi:transcriptional regulator with XRE-family HTH domain
MAPVRLAATPSQLKQWLKPTATTSEQIRALEGLGLAPSEVARAASVTPNALRSWLSGKARPRPKAAIALDDLRATANILLDDLEPERVASWLRGWNPAIDGRPIEVIGTAPGKVRAAAFDETL